MARVVREEGGAVTVQGRRREGWSSERATAGASPAFPSDPLLTASEVAEAMRVSNMTIYRLIKSGELGAVRVGRSYRIRRSEVDRFLSDRAVGVAVHAPLPGEEW